MKQSARWQLVKFLLTGLSLIIIPVYTYNYGVQNFLWLSDIGLFVTVVALWQQSVLLMSMAAVGVLAVELIWNIDFFVDLLVGINLIDLSDYMFDASYSLLLRGLSLFHVIMPIVWVLYIAQYGYDRRAFWYATIAYWVILLLTYTLTDSAENINWVFIPQAYGLAIAPIAWVAFLFVSFPAFIFLPTHFLFTKCFKTWTKYQDS